MSEIMRLTGPCHKLEAQLCPEKGGTIPRTESRQPVKAKSDSTTLDHGQRSNSGAGLSRLKELALFADQFKITSTANRRRNQIWKETQTNSEIKLPKCRSSECAKLVKSWHRTFRSIAHFRNSARYEFAARFSSR
jgi:hypothetical protein